VGNVGGDLVGAVHHLVGGDDVVEEADLLHLFGQQDAAGEQDVGGVGDADHAREEPGQAVLGGEAEAGGGGGEFGAGGGVAQVAETGDGDRDAGAGAVDGSNHRDAQAPVPDHVVVELRPDPVPGLRVLGQVDRGQVLLVGLGVEPEGLGVSADAELAAGSGHHHGPDRGVRVELGHQVAVLGVHPVGPGVAAPGTV
jgi:hypothetical protein